MIWCNENAQFYSKHSLTIQSSFSKYISSEKNNYYCNKHINYILERESYD